jgi:hypothetical protein
MVAIGPRRSAAFDQKKARVQKPDLHVYGLSKPTARPCADISAAPRPQPKEATLSKDEMIAVRRLKSLTATI